MILGAFVTSSGMLFHKVGAITENDGIVAVSEVHKYTKAGLTSIPVLVKCWKFF